MTTRAQWTGNFHKLCKLNPPSNTGDARNRRNNSFPFLNILVEWVQTTDAETCSAEHSNYKITNTNRNKYKTAGDQNNYGRTPEEQ